MSIEITDRRAIRTIPGLTKPRSGLRSPTRREVLRYGLSGVAIATLPATLSACDEDCDVECVQEIAAIVITLAKLSFSLVEEITGKLILRNSRDEPWAFQGLLDLVHNESGECQEQDFFATLAAGEEVELSFNDYYACLQGTHFMDLLSGGNTEASDLFDVG